MRPDLFDQVRQALLDTNTPPWFPALTQYLADYQWNLLEQELGIRRDNYGTVRVVTRNASADRTIAATLALPGSPGHRLAWPPDVSVESLSSRSLLDLFECRIPCYTSRDLAGSEALQGIADGATVLNSVSDAAKAVASLVRTLHILKSPDDDYDISFSDPRAPFSIFVSVPLQARAEAPWRLAEAILHEAMHLQLGVIEKIVPLLTMPEREYYSPWRNAKRPARGVLHGVYVFFAINHFVLRALPCAGGADVARYLTRRIQTLRRQFAQIESFSECDSLTAVGAAFASRMISQVLAPEGPISVPRADRLPADPDLVRGSPSP